jgi:hypothetical protein
MRILDSDIEQYFSADSRSAVLLVHIEWPTGPVFTHTGAGPQRWADETWYGTGEQGSIGIIKDGDTAGQLELTLVTNDPAMLAEVVGDDAAGSKVKIYLGALDENMRIAATQLIYSGFVNQTPISYDDPASISVDCVGIEYRWNQAKEHTRYTSAAQRSAYPTDSYCDDVEAIAKGPLSSYSASEKVGSSGGSGGTSTKNTGYMR